MLFLHGSFLLGKSNLSEFVKKLLDKFNVYGLVQKEGVLKLELLDSAEALTIPEAGRSLLPPKKILFPEYEVLFEYELVDSQDVKIKDRLKDLEKQKTVIFGLRPCDVRSISIMDKVLLGDIADPYYRIRRENTYLIAIICRDITDYCFCYFTNGGPAIDHGYDLLFTDLDDRYLVEVGSKKGMELIEYGRELFLDASVEDFAKKDELVNLLVAKMMDKYVLPQTELVYEKLSEKYNDAIWDEYGGKCLSCGKCNFVCPTCTCFDIRDEVDISLKRGMRIRTWDGCHFLSFTKVASGEVFRKEKPSRLKHRVYHKWVYSVNRIGDVSCVGCGRCIEVCPANVDLRKILKEVIG